MAENELYLSAPSEYPEHTLSALLTGAAGFLGASILPDLLHALQFTVAFVKKVVNNAVNMVPVDRTPCCSSAVTAASPLSTLNCAHSVLPFATAPWCCTIVNPTQPQARPSFREAQVEPAKDACMAAQRARES